MPSHVTRLATSDKQQGKYHHPAGWMITGHDRDWYATAPDGTRIPVRFVSLRAATIWCDSQPDPR